MQPSLFIPPFRLEHTATDKGYQYPRVLDSVDRPVYRLGYATTTGIQRCEQLVAFLNAGARAEAEAAEADAVLDAIDSGEEPPENT